MRDKAISFAKWASELPFDMHLAPNPFQLACRRDIVNCNVQIIRKLKHNSEGVKYSVKIFRGQEIQAFSSRRGVNLVIPIFC
jgi:hypothetical protein